MAVQTKEDLMAKLKTLIGDDTSDESLALVEDFNDTLSDLETKTSDTTNWKTKYEENDKAWRTKYRERFFAPKPNEEPPHDDNEFEELEKPLNYDDLFKEE